MGHDALSSVLELGGEGGRHDTGGGAGQDDIIIGKLVQLLEHFLFQGNILRDTLLFREGGGAIVSALYLIINWLVIPTLFGYVSGTYIPTCFDIFLMIHQ